MILMLTMVMMMMALVDWDDRHKIEMCPTDTSVFGDLNVRFVQGAISYLLEGRHHLYVCLSLILADLTPAVWIKCSISVFHRPWPIHQEDHLWAGCSCLNLCLKSGGSLRNVWYLMGEDPLWPALGAIALIVQHTVVMCYCTCIGSFVLLVPIKVLQSDISVTCSWL